MWKLKASGVFMSAAKSVHVCSSGSRTHITGAWYRVQMYFGVDTAYRLVSSPATAKSKSASFKSKSKSAKTRLHDFESESKSKSSKNGLSLSPDSSPSPDWSTTSLL